MEKLAELPDRASIAWLTDGVSLAVAEGEGACPPYRIYAERLRNVRHWYGRNKQPPLNFLRPRPGPSASTASTFPFLSHRALSSGSMLADLSSTT